MTSARSNTGTENVVFIRGQGRGRIWLRGSNPLRSPNCNVCGSLDAQPHPIAVNGEHRDGHGLTYEQCLADFSY